MIPCDDIESHPHCDLLWNWVEETDEELRARYLATSPTFGLERRISLWWSVPMHKRGRL